MLSGIPRWLTKKNKALFRSESTKYEFGYLFSVLPVETRAAVIKYAARLLSTVEYDAIAFRGMSGAIFASALAFEVGKPLILVRKARTEEQSHAYNKVEGYTKAKTFIVADDFVASGETVKQILLAIKGSPYFDHMKCVGVLEANKVAGYLEGNFSEVTLSPIPPKAEEVIT